MNPDLGEDGALTWRCGCRPARGVICDTHCQWQACSGGFHTQACIRGERVEEIGGPPTWTRGTSEG